MAYSDAHRANWGALTECVDEMGLGDHRRLAFFTHVGGGDGGCRRLRAQCGGGGVVILRGRVRAKTRMEMGRGAGFPSQGDKRALARGVRGTKDKRV